MWRERLRTAMTEWQRCKDAESLLDGQRLADAVRWLTLKKTNLNKQEIDYINKSLWQSRWRIAKVSAGVFLPLALAFWFFIWSANNFSSPKVGFYVLLAKSGIYTLHPKMVQIPPDKDCSKDRCEFMMGSPDSDHKADDSEKPAHNVRFTKSFKISQTEVTFEQYEVFAYLIVRNGGCQNKDKESKPHVITPFNDWGYGKGQRPVINVSWHDAQCYALWLNKNYRLPTEAEWEYAARANTTTPYYWGDKGKTEDFAQFNKRKTEPVAQLKANAFGLYDMFGNVYGMGGGLLA